MVSTTIFRLRFNRNYTTFVKTSHGHVKVDFTPIVLLGRTENSQFGTADPEVVEGLKKHRDFGSLFYIEEEGREVFAKEAAEAAKKEDGRKASDDPKAGEQPAPAVHEAETGEGSGSPAPDAGADEGSGEDSGDGSQDPDSDADGNGIEEDSVTHDKSVTSKNKAIAYLLEKHGATFSQTADIAKMKEEALTAYNLVFDNWK